jgi:hypothetical protein
MSNRIDPDDFAVAADAPGIALSNTTRASSVDIR